MAETEHRPRFITPELVAELKSGRDDVWVLTRPLIYYSAVLHTTIIVPDGFETDYASVPRLPIVYAIWGNRAHREATIHDYLFRSDAVPATTFMVANRIFLEAMECLGKPAYIRYPMYWAVCVGSHSQYHRRSVNAKL